MTKWEYKTLEFDLKTSFWTGSSDFPDTLIENDLNLMGNEGWELVNTITNSEYHGQTSKMLLIFKRQKIS